MNSKETQPTMANDTSNSKDTFRSGRAILKLLIGACLAITALLYAVEIMSGAPNNLETTKERDNMFLAKTQSEPNRAIPPLDVYVPARIETATFALG
ncbi:MAG: hypothetical protein ACLP5H_14150 [Desulfomonilaceae bacterium]